MFWHKGIDDTDSTMTFLTVLLPIVIMDANKSAELPMTQATKTSPTSKIFKTAFYVIAINFYHNQMQVGVDGFVNFSELQNFHR